VVTAVHPTEEPFTIGILDPGSGDVTDLGRAGDLPTWTADGRVLTSALGAAATMIAIDPVSGARTTRPGHASGRVSPDGSTIVWPSSPTAP
jgi:hypothetical protein